MVRCHPLLPQAHRTEAIGGPNRSAPKTWLLTVNLDLGFGPGVLMLRRCLCVPPDQGHQGPTRSWGRSILDHNSNAIKRLWPWIPHSLSGGGGHVSLVCEVTHHSGHFLPRPSDSRSPAAGFSAALPPGRGLSGGGDGEAEPATAASPRKTMRLWQRAPGPLLP